MVHPSRWSQMVAVVGLGMALLCGSAQAQTFSAPKNVSNNADFSVTPQMAVDASGNISVVWEDDTASNSNILFSRSTDGGMTFSAPKNLSNTSGFSFNPRVAVDSKGAVSVVWLDDTPGNLDVFFSRSTDGVNFSTPQNLSNDSADQGNPQVAVGADGGISVVWENDDITLGVFFTHSSDGVTFSTPLDLTTNAGGSFSPQLAVGADGGINVVWEDDGSGISKISFSRSTDKGATFSAVKKVSNGTGNASGPVIAVDQSGNIDLAWVDDSPGRFVIMFSRSADKGATFSSPANASNVTGDSANPQMAVDANGNIYVAWQNNTSTVFNRDVFFAHSGNGGATFSSSLNLSNNPGNSINPSLNVDGAGNVNLGWQDTTPGKANILFTRSMDAGVTFPTQQNLSNDSGTSSDVQVVEDANGNIDVVWSDDTSGVSQVLFSRFTNPQKVNQPPVAIVNVDQTVECAGPNGNLVSLDGSKSNDPDGDALTFVWTDETGRMVGITATVQVPVALGTHTFTLMVTDAGGLSSTASTRVTVLDTTPPTLQVLLSPNTIWPANHKLVQVTAQVTTSDVCDAKPAVQLVSISSNGGDSDDIQAVGGGPVAFGTDVRSFLLRAELSHDSQRVYTVTYMSKDASGNATLVSPQVVVGKPASTPTSGSSTWNHGKGKGKDKGKDKDKDKKHDHDD